MTLVSYVKIEKYYVQVEQYYVQIKKYYVHAEQYYLYCPIKSTIVQSDQNYVNGQHYSEQYYYIEWKVLCTGWKYYVLVEHYYVQEEY